LKKEVMETASSISKRLGFRESRWILGSELRVRLLQAGAGRELGILYNLSRALLKKGGG
jgi:hypothetical protein